MQKLTKINWALFAGFSLALLSHGAYAGDDLDLGVGRFTECGGSKCIEWRDQSLNDCRIRDARLTFEPNGKVTWHAIVRSGSSGDSYCTTLSFRDENGTPVFNFPRFCQDLTGDDSDWDRANLGVPVIFFNSIDRLRRLDHC